MDRARGSRSSVWRESGLARVVWREIARGPTSGQIHDGDVMIEMSLMEIHDGDVMW